MIIKYVPSRRTICFLQYTKRMRSILLLLLSLQIQTSILCNARFITSTRVRKTHIATSDSRFEIVIMIPLLSRFSDVHIY